VAESYAAAGGTDATGGDVTANATSLPPSTWWSSDFLIFFFCLFVSLRTKIGCSFPDENRALLQHFKQLWMCGEAVSIVAPIAVVDTEGECGKTNRIRHGSLKEVNKTRKVKE
jgi:hypothetical protein